jgi:hypothetical protein
MPDSSNEHLLTGRRRTHPVSRNLRRVSNVLYILNRIYAQFSLYVNYTLYSFLWLFLGGTPPTTHTRPLKSRNTNGVEVQKNPSVFVTGAHQGIGRAIALLLARSGWTVFADVRQLEHGRELEQELMSPLESGDITGSLPGKPVPGGAIHPIVCDVLDRESIENAVKTIDDFDIDNSETRPFVGVVINAGFCMISPMELTERADIEVGTAAS